MGKLINAVKNWIQQEQIPDPTVEEVSDSTYTSFAFKAHLEGVSYQVHLDCHEESGTFSVYVYWPRYVPEDRRGEVAALFARLNLSEVVLGNFDLDMDRGTVRFRNGMMLEDTELTMSVIESMATVGVRTMDKWAASILAVAVGKQDVTTALLMGTDIDLTDKQKLH